MTLVTMKEILLEAEKKNYGVPAFSILNTDALRGVMLAVEEARSPIILQMAEVRMEVAPLEFIGPALLGAAHQAKGPVAVHLDHGIHSQVIKQALDLGFSSVMIDASAYPIQENIARTKKIVALAADYGATVEAELGRIGGSEGTEEIEAVLTLPEEAEEFVEKTSADALAVGIGNVHGLYRGKPNLQFDLLAEIQERVSVPLVLHGGSGISAEEFSKCIDLGIRKINIATALYGPSAQKVSQHLFTKEGEESSFIELQKCTAEIVYEHALKHIHMFHCHERI